MRKRIIVCIILFTTLIVLISTTAQARANSQIGIGNSAEQIINNLSINQPDESNLIDNVRQERIGAWLDSLNFKVVFPANTLTAINDGAIEMSTLGLIEGYKDALADPNIEVELNSGSFRELTVNPAEFYDTNQLNPFRSPAIREALNYLIDRDHITISIFDGMAVPKLFPIMIGFPDYVRYSEKTSSLETKYAYDLSIGASIIDAEMVNMGAYRQGGKWYYNGEPITLIFIIRNEDKRLQIGDYIADQLESVDFTVDRRYVSAAESSEYWIGSDPADGTWHLYTGGWSSTSIPRDEGDNFQFFYSPNSAYGFTQLWQTYQPTPEFFDLCEILANHTYLDMTERDTAFNRALELALEDSVRVWLVDENSYLPRRTGTTAVFDLAAGLSRLYPYTARFLNVTGGNMTFGSPDILMESWNPIAGSNWAYDRDPQLATEDNALLPNPTNGLPMAQRIESAVVTAQNGLPILDSSDWVTLEFAASVEVPSDAWADWDAENQRFILASEKHVEGETARIKSVVTYPGDLFTTIKWHDGSPLSIGDFIMKMIISSDRSKVESQIYDENADNIFDSDIKAIKITSTNPLVIETYTDSWQLDAESNVFPWWPTMESGPLPWHTTHLAAQVEADGFAAFSSDKAGELGIEWLNYLSGATITYMNNMLASATNDIPYSNTLAYYITTDEASTRWTNLKNWYTAYGHFWVGNGPFYIDDYNWNEKTLHMNRFPDFPDETGKWDQFSADPNPLLEINYTEGAPGSYFTLTGSLYPPESNARVYINNNFITEISVDSNGEFLIVLDTTDSDIGTYEVFIKANPAAITSYVLIADGDIHDNEDPGAPIIKTGRREFYLPLILKN